MKKTMFVVSTLVTLIVIALFACNTDAKSEATVTISQDSLIKRGSYLVNSAGCDHCHSPKIMGAHGPELDMEHRFAGHLATMPIGKVDTSVMKNGWMLFGMDLTSYVGPWGVSFAANISSDGTGIGNWSEEQFIYCLRNGKSKGMKEGRALLPPMPWESFARMTDTDLRAIFAYLKTTKPIENRVPGPRALTEL